MLQRFAMAILAVTAVACSEPTRSPLVLGSWVLRTVGDRTVDAPPPDADFVWTRTHDTLTFQSQGEYVERMQSDFIQLPSGAVTETHNYFFGGQWDIDGSMIRLLHSQMKPDTGFVASDTLRFGASVYTR